MPATTPNAHGSASSEAQSAAQTVPAGDCDSEVGAGRVSEDMVGAVGAEHVGGDGQDLRNEKDGRD